MKILIVGRPKTGTSMLAGKIKTGLDTHLNLNSQFLFEPRAEDWIEQIQENNITKILYSRSPRHLSSLEETIEVGKKFDKKVIICRDPRDTLISSTLYRWYHRHQPEAKYFRQVLELLLQKEKNPASVNLYSISSISIRGGKSASLERYKATIKNENHMFSETASKLHHQNWHLVKYEDIVSQNNTALNEYLEFEISDDINFQRRAFLRTARSKTYGNWRNWFTEDDVIFFKPVFEECLEILGYDAQDWELNSEQQIDSSKSSSYIIKLFQGEGDFQ